MIAEIITVGTEIIIGSILNTNTKYLSMKLLELGIETFYHTSVDDNEERLINVFNTAYNRADLIITTGGLGPTNDDLTKEVIAKALGLPLERDSQMVEKIVARFTNMHRKMTLNNVKQAEKPVGSEFIPNDNGTAPGVYIEHKGKKIVLLPGPPRELEPMFEKYVVNLIKDDYSILVRSVNTSGIGESALENVLKSLDIYKENFEIATFASEGEVEIKIIGRGEDKEYLQRSMDEIMNIIKQNLGEYIYGFDNIPVEKLLIDKLKEKGLGLSLCESVTGGLITSRITSIPGASLVLDRGLVTYSNRAKMDELNVNEETLEKHSAVSKETAYEMAKGLINKTKSDLVLSITGYAGPDGEDLGLVYLCIMNDKEYTIIENKFMGNRTTIQRRAASRALVELYKFINKN